MLMRRWLRLEEPVVNRITAREKSERAAQEKNRAKAVALNAKVRRTKALLMEEVPKLQKLALKKRLFCLHCKCIGKPVKGSLEEFATRSDLDAALPHRIQSIPDGTSGGGVNQNAGWSGSKT